MISSLVLYSCIAIETWARTGVPLEAKRVKTCPTLLATPLKLSPGPQVSRTTGGAWVLG